MPDKRMSPTLLDLPLEIANKVFEELTLKELLNCRKVCRSLRAAAIEFKINLEWITIHLESFLEIKFHNGEEKYCINYAEASNDSTILTHNKLEKNFDGENYLKFALKDLETVLKHVSILYITTKNESGHRQNCAAESLIDLLKVQKPVYVEELRLNGFEFNDVLTILPYFNSKFLNGIRLYDMKINEEFEKITYLEQWKLTKSFKYFGEPIRSGPLECLFHFEFFRIILKTFLENDAIQIRDDLLKRSTFRGCNISYQDGKFGEIARVFKPEYADEQEFEYKNNNSTFRIVVECYSFACYICE